MSAPANPMWRWQAGSRSGVCRCGGQAAAQRHAEPYITGKATGLVERIVLGLGPNTCLVHLPAGAVYAGRRDRERVVWAEAGSGPVARASLRRAAT
jgi:hypothetical protein